LSSSLIFQAYSSTALSTSVGTLQIQAQAQIQVHFHLVATAQITVQIAVQANLLLNKSLHCCVSHAVSNT
jgi:hypothetical protein